ncbi:MAG TPA: Rho termination factor N-terminal domain-containing protein, partial [Dehalococcoidia bacterium]|nr:Rho termination factor N-terminal domain-containing protein [Dehalococcoidia bacterium]
EGDKWIAKKEKGPSDPQAARGPTTPQKSTDRNRAETAGGRTVPLEDSSKDDLYNRAQQLDIAGRSKMSKDDLVKAVKKH